MANDSYKSKVESKLTWKGRSGKDDIYACPACESEEHGHHLQVNYDKGFFNCFKCGFGGRSIRKLLRKLGLRADYDYDVPDVTYASQLDEVLDIGRQIKFKKPEITVKRDFSYDLDKLTKHFYENSTPLSQGSINYLYSRGITPQQIAYYGMRDGLGYYKNRIMIPSINERGQITFFVARAILSFMEPRYLNPSKDIAIASEDLFNFYRIQSNFIIVCEGVMTAITAGGHKFNATATYGKSLSERANKVDDNSAPVKSQAEKLLEANFGTYFIAYDADAREEILDTAEYLYDRGKNVRVAYIDPDVYGKKADVNSIGWDNWLHVLQNAPVYDRFLDIFL